MIKIKLKYCFLICIGFSLFFKANATQFHIAPDGNSAAIGSINAPWDLQTALNHPAIVLPGDTLWLHGGIYSGYFTSQLTGSEGNYIYVLQYPDERATIEDYRQFASGSTLQINGSWTIYKDFEVCNSNTNRTSSGSDSFRPMGLQVQAANTKFINLIVHDVGHGFGFWKEAIDAEIYGCIIYNCGTFNKAGQYSTHGHGIYSQNNTGTKTIKNNLIFNQFGFGLHIYPNPGHISGYLIEGNTLYHNGILTHDTVRFSNILINHYSPYVLKDIQILDNHTYDAQKTFTYKALIEADLYLGATNVNAKNLVVQNNYLMGQGRAGMAILNWDSIVYQENTSFYLKNGTLGLALPSGTNNKAYSWNNNLYYSGNQTLQFSYQYGSSGTFSSWKTLTGFDSNSSQFDAEPMENKIFVQANAYEPGRANVTIYNWENLSEVSIDLSSIGLKEGQSYQIVDAANYYAAPISSGVYSSGNSSIHLYLNSLTTSAPVGMNSISHTAPYFATCIVLPGSVPNFLVEKPIENLIKVYPNPCANTLNLSYFAEENLAVLCRIYNAVGSIVIEQKLESLETGWVIKNISVKELHDGVYQVKLIYPKMEFCENFVVLNNK